MPTVPTWKRQWAVASQAMLTQREHILEEEGRRRRERSSASNASDSPASSCKTHEDLPLVFMVTPERHCSHKLFFKEFLPQTQCGLWDGFWATLAKSIRDRLFSGMKEGHVASTELQVKHRGQQRNSEQNSSRAESWNPLMLTDVLLRQTRDGLRFLKIFGRTTEARGAPMVAQKRAT